MSMLKEFRGQGQEFDFGNEQKVMLKQLNVDELAEFAQIQELKNIREAVKFILITTLKKSIPDCTDEEINDLSPDAVNRLIPFIMKLNKLGGDDQKKDQPENFPPKKD